MNNEIKTNFVLPYRDRFGKYKHALDNFIDPFINYLNSKSNNYEIIIIEQSDKHELFNLGRNINIGFDILRENMNMDDIFIFHPVDILPTTVNYFVNKTTKFCARHHSSVGHHYKAIAFLISDFIKVNGYTNDFWGWGAEDDEMFIRLDIAKIDFDVSINDYEKLCDDGNGSGENQHYMPTINNHYIIAEELKKHKNLNYSGLNTLEYKILDESYFNGIKKYLIE